MLLFINAQVVVVYKCNMQQISFPYVRGLAVKFLSFYDYTFTVSITLSLKSRPETIYLLN